MRNPGGIVERGVGSSSNPLSIVKRMMGHRVNQREDTYHLL